MFDGVSPPSLTPHLLRMWILNRINEVENHFTPRWAENVKQRIPKFWHKDRSDPRVQTEKEIRQKESTLSEKIDSEYRIVVEQIDHFHLQQVELTESQVSFAIALGTRESLAANTITTDVSFTTTSV